MTDKDSNSTANVHTAIDRMLAVYHKQAEALDDYILSIDSKKRSKLKKLLRETVGMAALKTCLSALSKCSAAEALKIANELLAPSVKPLRIPPAKGQAKKRTNYPKRTQPQANNHISINSLEP